MRTGVRHGAPAEVFDEVLQLAASQRIIGFDGVAADSFGDRVFSQTRGIYFVAGGFEFVNEFKDEATRIRDFDERRQGVEQERALAKFAEADTQSRERGQLLPQEIGIARRDLDCFRQKQFLRGRLGVAFETVEHLLEENPFVGGMLIQQDEATIRFEHDIKPPDDTHKPQRNVKKSGGR